MKADDSKAPHDHANKVSVVVVTSAGSYPPEGEDEVPVNQKVEVELKRVQRELKIQDTAGWVVKGDLREINPALSWIENGLAGRVSVDWGPPIGGGG